MTFWNNNLTSLDIGTLPDRRAFHPFLRLAETQTHHSVN
jgi:hypothetical protein